jgi:hypothetical protein
MSNCPAGIRTSRTLIDWPVLFPRTQRTPEVCVFRSYVTIPNSYSMYHARLTALNCVVEDHSFPVVAVRVIGARIEGFVMEGSFIDCSSLIFGSRQSDRPASDNVSA